jgi:hypothetical protein
VLAHGDLELLFGALELPLLVGCDELGDFDAGDTALEADVRGFNATTRRGQP